MSELSPQGPRLHQGGSQQALKAPHEVGSSRGKTCLLPSRGISSSQLAQVRLTYGKQQPRTGCGRAGREPDQLQHHFMRTVPQRLPRYPAPRIPLPCVPQKLCGGLSLSHTRSM